MTLSLNFDAIRAISNINGNAYPMYSGFLSAKDIRTIAEVPSFARNKPHHQIASDIAQLPVDQWQRPLEISKTDKIKDTYSRDDKDNLMANPILIGIAAINIDQNVNVAISQKSFTNGNGNHVPIEDLFTVTVNYSDDRKPLWILDGQHRIEGMIKSVQKNEPVPFVLLYHESSYTPPFLAEIFTQVTTGATPMEFLHAEWMKYAFRLDRYNNNSHEKSMATVICLCKEVTLGGVANPLHNKIQFNPYVTSNGYFAFQFNMFEWSEIIANSYNGRGGSLEPLELATEIVKAIRAMEDVDNFKNNKGSKLFSNEGPNKILAEAFLIALLKHIATHEDPEDKFHRSLDEWVSFFIEPGRAFNRCNWSLPFIKTTGALSSGNGVPSKNIAIDCFDLAFNHLSALNGTLLTDYLQGVEAYIKITAFQKTATGRISNQGSVVKLFNLEGLKPFELNDNGIRREIIRIESETPNCYIINVTDPSINPPKLLRLATKQRGLDISDFPPGHEIAVETMNYSGDTKKYTKIKLDMSPV